MNYQVVNETCYNIDADKECVRILEHCRKEKIRISITCGVQTSNGQETWVESGRVSRSTGQSKIPILVHNKRSMGGLAIAANCVLKIQRSAGKQVMYEKK